MAIPVPTCTFLDESWLGIHYAPVTTITLRSCNAVINSSNQPIAVGATEWFVVDGAGVQVGTGSMAATATALTVASGGSWVGGTTIVPGYYTVYTNAGSHGVVTGAVSVCPS